MRATSVQTMLGVTLLLWAAVLPGNADVLVGTNGERFSGRVVEETADTVVFDSDLAGRLKISRTKIQEIQRTPPVAAPQPAATHPPAITSVPATNPPVSTNLDWRPPGVGLGQSDWIQLKTGEWLTGRLRYIQQRQVEFDSDQLEEQTFDFKDVRQVYPSKPFFTKFDGRSQLYGTVVISNGLVQVSGPEQVTLPRDQLTGITPGGNREIDFWSGNLNLSFGLQSGNTRQTSMSVSGGLARRTPATVVQLTYQGNYGQVEGVKSANNHRIDGLYDIRLNRHWFLRPVFLDLYKDELANIAYEGTLGIGVGYYIFDREGLTWTLSGGPGYQYTKYLTVEAGQSDASATPAGVLQTSLKADITRRLKFSQNINFFLTSEEAGLYSHHATSTLEFEIKRHLDLNLSLVWDYLQNPQTDSSGVVPKHSDLRVNVGIGVKF